MDSVELQWRSNLYRSSRSNGEQPFFFPSATEWLRPITPASPPGLGTMVPQQPKSHPIVTKSWEGDGKQSKRALTARYGVETSAHGRSWFRDGTPATTRNSGGAARNFWAAWPWTLTHKQDEAPRHNTRAQSKTRWRSHVAARTQSPPPISWQ
jgi:hypothetical protein